MSLEKVELQRLFETMYLIRQVEESLVEPIFEGDIGCPCHLYNGQEAVATALSHYLTNDDYVFGNHRSHGHYLAKGGDLNEMIAEIYCREAGCAKGRGGSMHLIDTRVGMYGAAPIVAGTISLALGASLAIKTNNEDKVAVTYFGDGATGEGVLYEALNFASLKKLPLIFVCENNLYSTHLPIDEIRVNRNISQIANAFDMKSYQLDGNDVLGLLGQMQEAVEYAKSQGPVFIEALTYRLRGHVGPDDNIQGTHTDIRPEKELAEWQKKDPLVQFEQQLLEKFDFNPSELEEVKRDIDKRIQEAHLWARKEPKPNAEGLFDHVFK